MEKFTKEQITKSFEKVWSDLEEEGKVPFIKEFENGLYQFSNGMICNEAFLKEVEKQLKEYVKK